MTEFIQKKILVRTETAICEERRYRLEIFLDDNTECAYSADLYRENADNWERLDSGRSLKGLDPNHIEAARVGWEVMLPLIKGDGNQKVY